MSPGLDARHEAATPATTRDDFYRLPGDRPERDTTLEHGELITGVILPPLTVPRNSTYLKVRDRASYAFALVSAAAAAEVRDGRIADVRIALGGVAHKPWRAARAEQTLHGQVPSRDAFLAAADAELADATALEENAFKLPMTRNALVSVLERLIGDAP